MFEFYCRKFKIPIGMPDKFEMKRIFIIVGMVVGFLYWHSHSERREHREKAVSAFKEAALERQQESLDRYQEYLKKVQIYKEKRQDYQRQWQDYQKSLAKYYAQREEVQRKMHEARRPAALTLPPFPEEPILVPSDEHRLERDHEIDFQYIEEGVTLEDLKRRTKLSEEH